MTSHHMAVALLVALTLAGLLLLFRNGRGCGLRKLTISDNLCSLDDGEIGFFYVSRPLTPIKNPWVLSDEILSDSVGENEAREVAEKVCRELGRYPRNCIDKMALRTVIISKNLRINGHLKGGASFRETIIINASFDINGLNLARLVHHEVFHLTTNMGYDAYTRAPTWPQTRRRADFVSDIAYEADSAIEDAAETFAYLNYGSVTAKPSAAVLTKTTLVLEDFLGFCPSYQSQAVKGEGQ